MVKVSVIVPVYNVEQYMDKCLNSLINQTLSDIEIILVDDGSTDNSGKKCDDYALNDKRIKVIHQKNKGLSAARQSGLSVCKGEYIAHIDSDDFVNEDYLKILYNFGKDNDADIVIAQIKFYRENIFSDAGVFLGGQIYRELNQKLSILRNDKDKCWTSVVNKIYSKNLINTMENHKNPPNLSVGEDCLWMIKAAFFANKIATVDDSTYFYRYNPTSLTHIVNDKMLKDKDTTTKEIIKFMNEYKFDKTSVETVLDNCIWHNLFDKSKTLDYLKLSIYSKYYEKSIFNLKYLGKFLKCNIQFFKYKLTFNKNRKKYKEKYLILKNQLKNFYE